MPDVFRDMWIRDAFLEPESCRSILSSVEAYRQGHSLPKIFRPDAERALHYYVIHGGQVAETFPDLQALYPRVQQVAEALSGLELRPMAQEMVRINVNITPPGGTYRWHYDRNALTAILFLNEVPGGETEVYPGYRLYLKNRAHTALQAGLDKVMMNAWLRKLAGRKEAVAPAAGRLLVMRGDRCLHSVRPVEGSADRINVIFSFDGPDARHPQADRLNEYLYTDRSVGASDPNYRT